MCCLKKITEYRNVLPKWKKKKILHKTKKTKKEDFFCFVLFLFFLLSDFNQ